LRIAPDPTDHQTARSDGGSLLQTAGRGPHTRCLRRRMHLHGLDPRDSDHETHEISIVASASDSALVGHSSLLDRRRSGHEAVAPAHSPTKSSSTARAELVCRRACWLGFRRSTAEGRQSASTGSSSPNSRLGSAINPCRTRIASSGRDDRRLCFGFWCEMDRETPESALAADHLDRAQYVRLPAHRRRTPPYRKSS
jgi:hypothetical protein